MNVILCSYPFLYNCNGEKIYPVEGNRVKYTKTDSGKFIQWVVEPDTRNFSDIVFPK